MAEPKATIRVDKWLWYARFFKTRGLARALVSAGHVRLNSNRISKASQNIAPEDVLTFPQGKRIRVIKVLSLGNRRGPATEAQTLYSDLSPPDPKPSPSDAQPTAGPPPSKKERRSAAKLKGFDLE